MLPTDNEASILKAAKSITQVFWGSRYDAITANELDQLVHSQAEQFCTFKRPQQEDLVVHSQLFDVYRELTLAVQQELNWDYSSLITGQDAEEDKEPLHPHIASVKVSFAGQPYSQLVGKHVVAVHRSTIGEQTNWITADKCVGAIHLEIVDDVDSSVAMFLTSCFAGQIKPGLDDYPQSDSALSMTLTLVDSIGRPVRSEQYKKVVIESFTPPSYSTLELTTAPTFQVNLMYGEVTMEPLR